MVSTVAKVIFYLRASTGKLDDLVSACKALREHTLVVQNNLELAVMKPRASDILAIPANSSFLDSLELILEIVAPPGRAIRALKEDLRVLLEPVFYWVERNKSSAVSTHVRAFQESCKKATRYHYHMYRRQDFSRADYMDYYCNSHYRFGIASPLAEYHQNYVDIESSTEISQIFDFQIVKADNISELRFDDIDAYLFSDVIRKVGPAAAIDEEKFVNRSICQSFSMDVLLDTRDYQSRLTPSI